MSLTLNDSIAINQIADAIYRFFPGTPHPHGAKHLSFPAIAQELGLGSFWIGGSKRPAIIRLLEHTLIHKRSSFCWLMIEVVRRGIEKCNNSTPVTREEVESLNKAILAVSFNLAARQN